MGSCSTCSKNRVDFKCALCDQEICKSCTEFLAEDAFHYSDEKPFDMQKNHFCINCHIQKVLPELDAYEDLLNKAKNIRVFDKSQIVKPKSQIYNRFIFSNSLIISSIGSVPTEILIILASNPASSKNFLPSSVCNKS